jgi:hypothetical protein
VRRAADAGGEDFDGDEAETRREGVVLAWRRPRIVRRTLIHCEACTCTQREALRTETAGTNWTELN